jgi:hypothetical protein
MKQVKINEILVRNTLMLEAIGEGVYGVDKNGVCFFYQLKCFRDARVQ